MEYLNILLLQVSVRNEVSQSLEPVRRLPQMLASLLPSDLPSLGGGYDPSRSSQGPSSQTMEAEVQAAVRAVVSEEVSTAVQQILVAQVGTTLIILDMMRWQVFV